jgi:histidyl-tRNA synthetase
MTRNPLRVLDCKEPGCRRRTEGAPSIYEFLCAECRRHFGEVTDLLRSAGVGFELAPRMVRGLDYYCRTTFEWTSRHLGAQDTVAAGGRYDGLVEELGGPSIPGVGFALGMERVALLMDRLPAAPRARRPDLYMVWIGRSAGLWSFTTAHRLRNAGLSVELEGEEKSLKSQMRRADKLKARFVSIVGEDELNAGRGVLRDMDAKEQVEVELRELPDELRRRGAGKT